MPSATVSTGTPPSWRPARDCTASTAAPTGIPGWSRTATGPKAAPAWTRVAAPAPSGRRSRRCCRPAFPCACWTSHPAWLATALEAARGTGRWADVEGETADASAMPFADATFDTVLAIHMLYHLPDPATGAAELRRVRETRRSGADRAERPR
ncbi:class I SAM-dependent methyltransferase [Caulobacter segnis]